MSTECQKTTAKAIPSTRRVTINDAAHMPQDYSTTPGGTLFSTTPGGMDSYSFSIKHRDVEIITARVSHYIHVSKITTHAVLG